MTEGNASKSSAVSVQTAKEMMSATADPTRTAGRAVVVFQALVIASLITSDMSTDWAIAVDFLWESDTRWWGVIALGIILLASIGQVPVGLYMDADEHSSVGRTGRQRFGSARGVLSIFVSLCGLRPLVETGRFAVNVGILGKASDSALAKSGYDLRASFYRLGVSFSQIVEFSFETAPQLNLQAYVMVYRYMKNGQLNALLACSMALSVVSMGVGAGLNYSAGFQKDSEPKSVRASAVLHAVLQILLRLMTTSMIAVEFGPWLSIYMLYCLVFTALHVYHVHVTNNLQHWPFWVGTIVAVMPSYFLALDTTDKDGPLGMNLYNCWVSVTMLSPRASAICFMRAVEGLVVFAFLLLTPALPSRGDIPLAFGVAGFAVAVSTCISYFVLRWAVRRKQRKHGCKGTKSIEGAEPAIYSVRPELDMQFLFGCFPRCCRREVSTMPTYLAGDVR